MNYPEKRREFTISELSHACGISRKTLIRMEESGFLTPYRINPDTGYRYYDAHNASEVGQYQLLQTLGLSRAQITEYYYNRGDVKSFLNEQRIRLIQMQRVLEELEIRNSNNRDPIISFFNLPEMVCYCVKTTLSSPEDAESFFYSAQEECIAKGFRLLGGEPLFGLRSDDYRNMVGGNSELPEVTACIPVSEPIDSDPHMRLFPAARLFSILAYGDYSIIPGLWFQFWKEIEARGIHYVGPVRFIGIVAPYVGKHIKPDEYCYRIAVPVESDQDCR
ncbi:MAG: MerR family transcriptional regulator [Lachnospiraceae bacterium]|nr:MerR family transcriptional regulator [Lachnospiraceae bacterium]